MEQSDRLSRNDVESISMNFTELRQRGLSYIQELSGDIWTDYNAHDPGVTILDQLCYALTDIAYRTSLPITFFLAPFVDEQRKQEADKNAFFAPSIVLSSPAVTIEDLRKVIINEFDEIENAWVLLEEDQGYKEKLRGLYQIEILPKPYFRRETNQENSLDNTDFLNRVRKTMGETRSIGEDFFKPIILENQDIAIDFEIHITKDKEIERTLADLFIDLFDFLYSPVHRYSFEEMRDSGYTVDEIFSGPKMGKGFIKDSELKNRVTRLNINELQKLFLKVSGVRKCTVNYIINVEDKNRMTELHATPGKYLNVLYEKELETVFKRMKVYSYRGTNQISQVSETEAILGDGRSVLDYSKLEDYIRETWSKRHRQYNLESQNDFFDKKLEGHYKNKEAYYSIQNHFPMIYGIGKEVLPNGSDMDSVERKAKALQLKAYLLFFEKHLANHLSQLGNMNEFFNIFFDVKAAKERNTQTYFSQPLDQVPEIDRLRKGEEESKLLEPEDVFFRRKHRIYDHLLARFGEDLNDLPWRLSKDYNLIKSERDLQIELLDKKADFLKTLGNLNPTDDKRNYHGVKGEVFRQGSRVPSGLEQVIMAKTGIHFRAKREKIKVDPDTKELEGFYVVDHILLRDFLQDTKSAYGFSFRDEHNISQFETKAEDNWSITEKEREARIEQFYSAGLNINNYLPRDERTFKKEGKCVIVDFETDKERREIQAGLWRLWEQLDDHLEAERIELLKNKIPELLKEHNEYDTITEIGLKLREIEEVLLKDFEAPEELSTGEKSVLILKSYVADISMQLKELYAKDSFGLGKHKESNVLATYDLGEEQKRLKELVKEKKIEHLPERKTLSKLYKDTTNFIRLFHDPDAKYTQLRLSELEKKRAKGSKYKINQKRLVLQRKIGISDVTSSKIKAPVDGVKEIGKDFIIVDEDFFDLQITILFPSSPKRFRDPRFKAYVTDLIQERAPAHIANTILWLDKDDLKEFEEIYNRWEVLKSDPRHTKEPSTELKIAAYKVYKKISQLKKA